MKEYEFAVWTTQGGGLVRLEPKAGAYCIFVETPPGFPDIKVGDRMNDEWDLIPANRLASQPLEEAALDPFEYPFEEETLDPRFLSWSPLRRPI